MIIKHSEACVISGLKSLIISVIEVSCLMARNTKFAPVFDRPMTTLERHRTERPTSYQFVVTLVSFLMTNRTAEIVIYLAWCFSTEGSLLHNVFLAS